MCLEVYRLICKNSFRMIKHCVDGCGGMWMNSCWFRTNRLQIFQLLGVVLTCELWLNKKFAQLPIDDDSIDILASVIFLFSIFCVNRSSHEWRSFRVRRVNWLPIRIFSKARCLRIAWRSGQLLKRFVIFCRGGCKINVRLTTVESRMWQTSQSGFNLRLNEKHLRTIHVRHSASSIIPERKEDSWFWFAVIGKAEFTKKKIIKPNTIRPFRS